MNLDFIGLLKLLTPVLIAAVPQGEKYVPLITAGMAVAESSAKKNKDKKQIALDSVRASAVLTNTLAGEKKIDPDAAVIVADDTIDSIVDLINGNLKQVNSVVSVPLKTQSEIKPAESKSELDRLFDKYPENK